MAEKFHDHKPHNNYFGHVQIMCKLHWRQSLQMYVETSVSPPHLFQKRRSVTKMQRSTWRLVSDEGVHKIDMPPAPPLPRGRPSRQSAWSMEKPAAVFVQKFIWLYIAAAILIALLVTALWLWYSGSGTFTLAIDDAYCFKFLEIQEVRHCFRVFKF